MPAITQALGTCGRGRDSLPGPRVGDVGEIVRAPSSGVERLSLRLERRDSVSFLEEATTARGETVSALGALPHRMMNVLSLGR